MTIDQALQMAEMLVKAANVAYQSGTVTVSLLDTLKVADDIARAELQAAIESTKLVK